MPPPQQPTKLVNPSADRIIVAHDAKVGGNLSAKTVAAQSTGAVAPSRFVGGTSSSPPRIGYFSKGDFAVDSLGIVWVCTGSGTPGTWVSAANGSIHIEVYLNSATTAIPNNALTTVVYDTVEGGLSANFSTVNGILTVPIAGRYEVGGTVIWNVAVAANQYITVVKNGAEHRRMTQTSASHFGLSGARVARCAANDTLGIGAFQGSGAAVTMLNGPSLTSMSITYLGAL